VHCSTNTPLHLICQSARLGSQSHSAVHVCPLLSAHRSLFPIVTPPWCCTSQLLPARSCTQQRRDVDGAHYGPGETANHKHDPSPVWNGSMGHNQTSMALDARWDDAASVGMRIERLRGRDVGRADDDARIVAVGGGHRIEVGVDGWSERGWARLQRCGLAGSSASIRHGHGHGRERTSSDMMEHARRVVCTRSRLSSSSQQQVAVRLGNMTRPSAVHIVAQPHARTRVWPFPERAVLMTANHPWHCTLARYRSRSPSA
jgi:hypothetical protein